MIPDKLSLNEKMKDSYLIQRLQAPVNYNKLGLMGNPFSFGGGLVNGGFTKEAMSLFQPIFSFDYMGAAEFEFGAVPEAFSFLYEQRQANNLTSGVLTFGDDIVYVISPIPYKEEVEKRITLLKNNDRNKNMMLKEYCGLKDYFDPAKKTMRRACGWIELDNGFMFFGDKDMFEKTCNLFMIPYV